MCVADGKLVTRGHGAAASIAHGRLQRGCVSDRKAAKRFTNIFRTHYAVVLVGQLEKPADERGWRLALPW